MPIYCGLTSFYIAWKMEDPFYDHLYLIVFWSLWPKQFSHGLMVVLSLLKAIVVPHLAVTHNYKLFLVWVPDYNFPTILNHNINIFGDRYLPKCDSQAEKCWFRKICSWSINSVCIEEYPVSCTYIGPIHLLSNWGLEITGWGHGYDPGR